MPWAQHEEPEFLTDGTQPEDYLKKTVWAIGHKTELAFFSIVYDGVFGLYKVNTISGVVPKELQGLYTSKDILIAKIKSFLRSRSTGVPFSEEDLENTLTDEEVKERYSNRAKGRVKLNEERGIESDIKTVRYYKGKRVELTISRAEEVERAKKNKALKKQQEAMMFHFMLQKIILLLF